MEKDELIWKLRQNLQRREIQEWDAQAGMTLPAIGFNNFTINAFMKIVN
jgi:hypothetical protein